MRLIDADELFTTPMPNARGNGKPLLSLWAYVVDQITHAPTIDPESLRPKGRWDIRCDYHVDDVTREADESFYLECSECKRKVWDVNQMAAMNGEYRKLIEQYPYCHCGCKMEG